jgi:hypothetical protein
MARKITFFLFFATSFLAACSGSFGPFEPTVTVASPPASEINAAAERAATEAGAATAEPATEISPVETPSADSQAELQPSATTGPTNPASAAPAAESEPATNRRVDVGKIGRFPQLIPFDGIRPVYEPVFATAEEAPLDDSELIIGIALDGEAKAYPITVLRFREMVNDEMAGIPILVTW